MDNLNVPSVVRIIQVNAGKPWGLACIVAAWIIRSGTALDQAGFRANPVEAALGLVSIAAKVDISKVTVPAARRTREGSWRHGKVDPEQADHNTKGV